MTSRTHTAGDEHLDAVIRSVFDDIVVATDNAGNPTASSHRIDTAAAPLRRRWLSVAAAVLLLAGVGGVVAVSQRPGSDTPAELGTDTSVSLDPSDQTTRQAVLSWQQASDVGSIAQSSVDFIVANDNGFVASGIGFGSQPSRGGVWYSADGDVWVEPASELFEAKTILGTAATDDAFYVLATADISDEHGTFSLYGDEIYRSTNGTDWTATEQPDATVTGIAAAGPNLLRQTTHNSMEWSVNGDDWFESELAIDEQTWTRFDLYPNGLIDADATYLRGSRSELGTENEEHVLWTSPDDGRTWTELPTPPFGGSMVETPDGVLIVYNPDEDRCERERHEAITQLTENEPAEIDLSNIRWDCSSLLETIRLDPENNQWNMIDASGPGPTPLPTPTARIGDTLVTPILEPGKSLTAWTASLDADDWAADPTSTLNFAENTGSPDTPAVAVSGNTIVIATPGWSSDAPTVVLVGNAT